MRWEVFTVLKPILFVASTVFGIKVLISFSITESVTCSQVYEMDRWRVAHLCMAVGWYKGGFTSCPLAPR